MDKLTLVQQVALSCDIDTALSKAYHKEAQKVECFLLLLQQDLYHEHYVNALKERFDSDFIDRLELNLKTLTIPYELLVDSAIQDIYLLKGKCHSITTKRAMFNVNQGETIIRGKLVNYLRFLANSSLVTTMLLINKIDKVFPEYSDITQIYKGDFETEDFGYGDKYSEMGATSRITFNKLATIFILKLADTPPINFSKEMELLEHTLKYAVEVRRKGFSAVVKRRIFDCKEDAELYKDTLLEIAEDSSILDVKIFPLESDGNDDG